MDKRGRDRVVSSVEGKWACDLTMYQKACVGYAAEYDHDFSLEPCWQILKDHSAWKQVEMPLFYSKQNPGSKKAKSSETTSGLAQGGLNLNEKADGSRKEVREVRPIGYPQWEGRPIRSCDVLVGRPIVGCWSWRTRSDIRSRFGFVGGLNLNEKADGSRKEVREVRPIGQDRAKKKASSSSHSEASSAAAGGLVDMVAAK
nr:hypothetical protein [Tanacetum cinerariifolium]